MAVRAFKPLGSQSPDSIAQKEVVPMVHAVNQHGAKNKLSRCAAERAKHFETL